MGTDGKRFWCEKRKCAGDPGRGAVLFGKAQKLHQPQPNKLAATQGTHFNNELPIKIP